ncbi:mucin TcMUCII [Trypanosoma cruzi]|nr:mucin TcMUCII [Trypanosoma cruzi]
MPGALRLYGGETGGPQTESGRDSEEGLRIPGPSLPKEAGTAITGQTPAPPESLSSASDNPEPRGLATQSPHTQGATGMSDAQNKRRSKIHEAMRIIRHRYQIRSRNHYNRGTEEYGQEYRGANHYDPHRHVFAKWTAASAALRGYVPRCRGRRIRDGVHHSGLKRCVRAVRASTQSRGFVRFYCGPMYKVRLVMMILFCFVFFRCHAVCFSLLPTSVSLNAS